MRRCVVSGYASVFQSRPLGSVSDYLVFHFSAKKIDSQIGFCKFSHDYF
jgi:hypothetical protein